MLPIKAVRLQLGELIAADATTLAPPALANIVRLVMAAFAAEENLVVADLTFATFDGSTALAAGLGTQQVGIDPVTLEQIVTIKEPAGGWRFEVTGATNLPQTIFGYALLTDGSAALLAVNQFLEPITLSAIGEEINLGTLKFTIVPQPMA